MSPLFFVQLLKSEIVCYKERMTKEGKIEKPMENIVISDAEKLKELKEKISRGRIERFHVLADFDRTLTTAFVDGKSIPSLISILRDGNYLGSDYATKAYELFDKYHPMEIDPKISLSEKKEAMQDWWMEHFDLLIKCGLNKKDIESAVNSGKVKFREGFREFSNFLQKNNIPLVIMSSSGLGHDAISMYLEKEKELHDNVFIISNAFEWDKEGNAVGVKKPIIHTLNKYETSVKDFPVFEEIKERKNVLLLGDSLDDAGMVEGFDYENLMKIGFLNEKPEENLEHYKQNFDAVVLNDSSLDFVNGLLKEMFNKE